MISEGCKCMTYAYVSHDMLYITGSRLEIHVICSLNSGILYGLIQYYTIGIHNNKLVKTNHNYSYCFW